LPSTKELTLKTILAASSSADLMNRNMFRRVEVGFPIESKRLKQRILGNLDCYLQDNSQAWLMQSDGSYVQPGYAQDNAQ
jgi:polyphosphate kinase